MAGLLRFDGPIGRWMGRMVDLFFLNMLWIICCLPIVTIAASTSAMYYVTLRMVRDEEGGIVRDFFRSFRQNLRQSVGLSLLYVLSGAFLLLVIYLFNHLRLGGMRVFIIFPYIGLAVHFVVFGYVFPLFARFDNHTGRTIKNAYLLAVRYPVNTLVVSVVNALPFVLAFFWPQMFAKIGVLWLLVMFALQSYWNATLFVRIFDQLAPCETDADREVDGARQL